MFWSATAWRVRKMRPGTWKVVGWSPWKEIEREKKPVQRDRFSCSTYIPPNPIEADIRAGLPKLLPQRPARQSAGQHWGPKPHLKSGWCDNNGISMGYIWPSADTEGILFRQFLTLFPSLVQIARRSRPGSQLLSGQWKRWARRSSTWHFAQQVVHMSDPWFQPFDCALWDLMQKSKIRKMLHQTLSIKKPILKLRGTELRAARRGSASGLPSWQLRWSGVSSIHLP